jgi:hypothetical protein
VCIAIENPQIKSVSPYLLGEKVKGIFMTAAYISANINLYDVTELTNCIV